MINTLKLTNVGNSVGVILPKERIRPVNTVVT